MYKPTNEGNTRFAEDNKVFVSPSKENGSNTSSSVSDIKHRTAERNICFGNMEQWPILCNVIPPTPKKPRTEVNTRFNEDDKVFISPLKDSVSNVSSPASNIQYGTAGQRRRSSTARYDFNDDFLRLALRSQLYLSPDVVLGRGSFGTVIAGMYKGNDVAVKVIKVMDANKKDQIEGEENALNLPSHPNIVKHLEILRIQIERALVIMERIHRGNLLSLINDPEQGIQLVEMIHMSREIASALQFCHQNGLLHLDVKPQNILVDSTGKCKLSDFGTSRRIAEINPEDKFTKLEGTVAYKAPELFQGKAPSTKCDAYSLAITMWQLLSRELPYTGHTEHSIIYKVVAQGLRPKAASSFSFVQNNFYKDSLQINAVKKYKLIYKYAWKTDPTSRLGVENIISKLNRLQKKLSISNCL